MLIGRAYDQVIVDARVDLGDIRLHIEKDPHTNNRNNRQNQGVFHKSLTSAISGSLQSPTLRRANQDLPIDVIHCLSPPSLKNPKRPAQPAQSWFPHRAA